MVIKNVLRKSDVLPDPIEQFERWFKEAWDANIKEAHAMTLATVDGEGQPSARAVLLKGFDSEGFVFFTNYNSRKARELQENPRAALLFVWKELGRQVRIEGEVIQTTPKDSDEYFRSRPLESRISAWASPQSEVIESRRLLEKRFLQLKNKFKGGNIPRPPHWGGFRLQPNQIEFWQSGSNRLHDRILYTKTGQGWRIERLAP